MDIGQFGEKENVFVPSGVLGLVKCQICLLDQLVGIVLPGRTPPMGDADAQRDAAIGQGRDWRGVGSLQELLGKILQLRGGSLLEKNQKFIPSEATGQSFFRMEQGG